MRFLQPLAQRLPPPPVRGRWRSLSVGIVLAMAAGLFVPALIGVMTLTYLRQAQIDKELERYLDDKVLLLSNSLAAPVWNFNTSSVNAIGQATLLDPQVVRISIRDADKAPMLMLERPERRLGSSRVVQWPLQYQDASSTRSEVVGFVEIEVDNSFKQQQFEKDRRAYSFILLGQFVVSLGFILLALHVRVLRPLHQLALFSNRLAGGDFEQPVGWQRPDEIGRLARQMDHMRSDLKAAFDERKVIEDEVKSLAFYDPLTQLPNRRLLLDRLKQALVASARSGSLGALLFIDLDHFKTLNDTLGHDKGDLLLQQVAQRLSSCVREGDTVARFGGDEFVVILDSLGEQADEAAMHCRLVGEKIFSTLNQPYLLAGHERRSTPSIGIAVFDGRHNTVEALLQQADLAMYQAKTSGRNTLRFFDAEMQAVATQRAALESDLREALQQQQFSLHYQPQVVGSGQVTGAEALLRWRHPVRGMVSPAEFIPLAEETDLILPLGQWVLETACRQLVAWAAQPATAALSMAVNVSARQMQRDDFVQQVLSVLRRTGARPQLLKLELTESVVVDDVEATIAKMEALKAEGVGFSLDDFGTGYSSLTYLKRLPLDQLKIDQGFIKDILDDPNDAAIAKMIIALAATLGLGVVAEGVELEEQRLFLARNGCHAYQGYLMSRPLPIAEFDALLRAA